MAVRHDFGGEKQSKEPSEGKKMQNPPSSKVGNPDNIDTLVSRFLDELSDISSGISEDGNAPAASKLEPEVSDNKVSILLNLADGVAPAPDSELDKINEEIEKSLAELESLRPESAPSTHSLEPDAQAQPTAAPEFPPIEAQIETATREVRIDSEEQTWNQMELFKREIVASQRRRHRIGWILAGAGLVVILGIASFLFFSSRKSSPKGVVKIQNTEPAKPAQTPGDIQQSAVVEKSAHITTAPQSGKPADVAKPAVQETKTKPASSSDRNANTGNNRTPATSAAGQKPTRQGQNGNSAAPTGKPRANEEPPSQAPPQAAAATTAPPEQPSPAVNSPSAPPQQKPNPTTPSGTTSNNNGNVPAAQVAASIPEAPPAAPKAAPASDAEAVNAASQPKTRTVVMSEAIVKVPPLYPPIARSQKVSGKVDVDVDVNEKGDVTRAKAVSGPALLRPAAEQALMKWKFKPASVDGANVPSKARIQVTFNVQQ